MLSVLLDSDGYVFLCLGHNPLSEIQSIIKILSRHNHQHVMLCIESVKEYCSTTFKLDGLGPVDNRHSTDYLHHFVQLLTDPV